MMYPADPNTVTLIFWFTVSDTAFDMERKSISQPPSEPFGAHVALR
jgi:hypothetical protein